MLPTVEARRRWCFCFVFFSWWLIESQWAFYFVILLLFADALLYSVAGWSPQCYHKSLLTKVSIPPDSVVQWSYGTVTNLLILWVSLLAKAERTPNWELEIVQSFDCWNIIFIVLFHESPIIKIRSYRTVFWLHIIPNGKPDHEAPPLLWLSLVFDVSISISRDVITLQPLENCSYFPTFPYGNGYRYWTRMQIDLNSIPYRPIPHCPMEKQKSVCLCVSPNQLAAKPSPRLTQVKMFPLCNHSFSVILAYLCSNFVFKKV